MWSIVFVGIVDWMKTSLRILRVLLFHFSSILFKSPLSFFNLNSFFFSLLDVVSILSLSLLSWNYKSCVSVWLSCLLLFCAFCRPLQSENLRSQFRRIFSFYWFEMYLSTSDSLFVFLQLLLVRYWVFWIELVIFKLFLSYFPAPFPHISM